MSSATLTDRPAKADETGAAAKPDAGVQAWHLYLLLAMAAATAAVVISRNTHPAALLLLSCAVLSAGLVAIAMHQALAGFFSRGGRVSEGVTGRKREMLTKEKALVLQAIKELEFDRAMGKVGEKDYTEMLGRLRARALSLMEDLERADTRTETRSELRTTPGARSSDLRTTPGARSSDLPGARSSDRTAVRDGLCASCGTANDKDAKFCKECGKGLA